MSDMNTRYITAATLPPVNWQISSRSGSGSGNCVEAGPIVDGSQRVAVRDSHQPDGPVIVYTNIAWTEFISSIKNGH
jgi:hypothetical protein